MLIFDIVSQTRIVSPGDVLTFFLESLDEESVFLLFSTTSFGSSLAELFFLLM